MPVASLEEVQYRSLRSEDQSAVVSFLRECGYDSDGRFWSWINRECPHGQALVELALVQDRVVGHYGVLPRPVWMDGKVVRAGLAIHAAVHPQFRGLEILRQLLARMVRRCRQEGIPFIYGFPRPDVWLMYFKLFDWKPMGELVTLELPLKGFRLEQGDHPRIQFRDRAVFDERYRMFDDLEWLGAVHHVVKDREFARWRYANHPRVRYPLLELQGEGGEPLGTLVLKLYEKEKKRYGHLVDLGLKPAAFPLFSKLVATGLKWFFQQGVDVASCWMLENSPLFGVIQEAGFQATGFTTYVGYRLVDPSFPTQGLGLERWHMVMGDSDAF